VEKAVRDLQQAPGVVEKRKDPDTLRLQNDLSEKIGAKVEINHQPGGKGKMIISYNSLEELDGIIRKIN
jgi:ParB family chromosome partitioning protein